MKKLLILFFIALQGVVQAQLLKGKVSHVYDGDTFRLNQPSGLFERIRLANIDAPEIKQSYGLLARCFLKKLIDKKVVEVDIITTDKYGRKVALLYMNGRQINRLLVAEGLAWNYPQYSTDTILVSVEKSARVHKIGLWQEENPTPPWRFRAERRQ